MTDLTSATDGDTSEPRFLVGSYVLETLTTGMYVEPRDAIREYVQNAFDGIEAARRERLLSATGGEIQITLLTADRGAIVIRDNGASIPSAQAWDTLTSIGASRKSPRRHAGFRGIGRLAGIAYCDLLEFECKAQGEREVTHVAFDCKAIRAGLLKGGTDLETVFRANIRAEPPTLSSVEDHYTEVRLIGTADAPEELRELSLLHRYLMSVAPIDFRDGWALADTIRERAESEFSGIPTVKVSIGLDDTEREEILKPYSAVTTAGKKTAPVRQAEFFNGGSFGATRWWGWYGVTPLYGQINDSDVAGIRMRVRNLQLDGTEIVTRLMSKINPSYDRFNSWHLGEIHLDIGDNSLIPNARRDGFEDSPGWREIQKQIVAALGPLANAAYQASNKRNSKDFRRVQEDTQREIGEIQDLLSGSDASSDDSKRATARKIKSALRRVEALNLEQYTDDQQRTLREAAVTLREFAEQAQVSLAAPKPVASTTATPTESYPDFLEAVFEVLTPMLDTRTFNRARRALIDRFKA